MPAVYMRIDMVRSDSQRAIEARKRFQKPMLMGQREPAIGERRHVIRRSLQRPVKGCFRLGIAPQLSQDRSALGKRIGMIGSQFQKAIKIGKRLMVVRQPHQHISATVKRVGIVGVDGKDATEITQRLIVAFHLHHGNATIEARSRVFGRARKHGVAVFHGLRRSPQIHQRRRQIGAGLERGWIDVDGPRNQCQGLRKFALLQLEDAVEVERFELPGCTRKQVAVVRLRFVQPTLTVQVHCRLDR